MDWKTFWESLDWNTLLAGLSVSTVLVLIAAFLGKKWIGTRIEQSVKHEYAKELEEHKAQLQEQITRTVEQVKSEFQETFDQKATDKRIFQAFLEDLPSDGDIDFINRYRLVGPFKWSQLEQLSNFCCKWDKPEKHFLDKELNAKREKLHKVIDEYIKYLSSNTLRYREDPDDHYPESFSVPDEWRETQPKKYNEIIAKLNSFADELVYAHEDLINAARKKLKC